LPGPIGKEVRLCRKFDNGAGHEHGCTPRLERFQEKWMPLFQLESAPKQRLRAFVLMQSKREAL
jgi:hypothetical protein